MNGFQVSQESQALAESGQVPDFCTECGHIRVSERCPLCGLEVGDEIFKVAQRVSGSGRGIRAEGV